MAQLQPPHITVAFKTHSNALPLSSTTVLKCSGLLQVTFTARQQHYLCAARGIGCLQLGQVDCFSLHDSQHLWWKQCKQPSSSSF
jgi:hypothetical protein